MAAFLYAGSFDAYSFTLKVGAAATDNYNGATKNATVTVTAKEVQTITAGDVSATYGDTNAKMMGSTNGDGAITYAVTGIAGVVEVDSSTGALTIKKAGTTAVTITAAETGEYAAATKVVTITVAQKGVTITGLGAENRIRCMTATPRLPSPTPPLLRVRMWVPERRLLSAGTA